MDRKALLQEVNKLVSSGLRKSAIDLINEYLEYYPNDPFVLSAMGRIYLLEKKPDQAVKYLQLSLGSRNTEPVADNHITPYGFDEIDHDDLDYIENSSSEEDAEYSYENEEVNMLSKISKDPPQGYHEKQIIDISGQQEIEESDNHELTLEDETLNNIFEPAIEVEDYFDLGLIELRANSTLDNEDYFLAYQSDIFDAPFQNELAELPDFEDETEVDEIAEAFFNEEDKSIED
jgi:hypothetical protein